MIEISVQHAWSIQNAQQVTRLSVLVVDKQMHMIDVLPETATPQQVADALRLLADKVEKT